MTLIAENDLEYLTLLLLPLECYRCALSHAFLIFSVEWGSNHRPYVCKARTLSAELCVQTLVSSYPQTKLQEQTNLIHFQTDMNVPRCIPHQGSSLLPLFLAWFTFHPLSGSHGLEINPHVLCEQTQVKVAAKNISPLFSFFFLFQLPALYSSR